LEVAVRREPRPNAGNRHGVVVGLWCRETRLEQRPVRERVAMHEKEEEFHGLAASMSASFLTLLRGLN
jgi:hypothetical protein